MAVASLMTPPIPYNQTHPGSPAHRRVRHGHARTTLRRLHDIDISHLEPLIQRPPPEDRESAV